jgi:hypothetical protein
MAAAAANAAELIERMLAIFGTCSGIVMGKTSHMGRSSRQDSNPGSALLSNARRKNSRYSAVSSAGYT